MTIRISASVMLIEPRSTDSDRYTITTTRARTTTCEDSQLEFELKFFYDLESNENAVPYAYLANEGIHFTGNFVGITKDAIQEKDVIQINVQQAHTLGMLTKIPEHHVEVNLNGQISASPKVVATQIPSTFPAESDGSVVDPADLNASSTMQISFTMFRVTAKQWASFACNDGSPGSTAKVVDFEFTVRHETNNRLNSRTKHLKCPRSVNVLGLLELINSNLYIQLTDIAWTPQATTATSHSPTGSEPDNSGTQPTRISRSRALAAQLSSTDTTPGTTGTSRKRTKVMQPVNSSSTSVIHDALNVSKGSTSTQPIQIEGESSSSEEQPATKTRTQITRRSSTRTTRGKRAKRAKASQDSGNSNRLYQSPSIKMVGGIPQLYNTPNTGRVAKLRDHATSVLPTREFSFF